MYFDSLLTFAYLIAVLPFCLSLSPAPASVSNTNGQVTETCDDNPNICSHGEQCLAVLDGSCRLASGECGKNGECPAKLLEMDEVDEVEPTVVIHPAVHKPWQWTRLNVTAQVVLLSQASPEAANDHFRQPDVEKPAQSRNLDQDSIETKQATSDSKSKMMRKDRTRRADSFVSLEVDSHGDSVVSGEALDSETTSYSKGRMTRKERTRQLENGRDTLSVDDAVDPVAAGGVLVSETTSDRKSKMMRKDRTRRHDGVNFALSVDGNGDVFREEVKTLNNGARTALERLGDEAQAEMNDEISSGKSQAGQNPAARASTEVAAAIATGTLTAATLQDLQTFDSNNNEPVESVDASGITLTADDNQNLGTLALGSSFTGEAAEALHEQTGSLAEGNESAHHGTIFDGTASTRVPNYIVNGKMQYCWAPAIDATARNVYKEAFKHISAHVPCLKFEEVTWVKNPTFWDRGCSTSNGVQLTSDQDGCYWGSGRANLGPGCRSKGVAIHELLHVLGVAHEQKRGDRDTYVQINWNNIQSGRASQFTTSGSAYTGQDYDFESLMHYGKDSFGQNTIEVRAAYNGRVLGNRHGMTTRDIEQLRDQYGCSRTASKWRIYTTSTVSYNIWDVSELEFYSDWNCQTEIQGGTPISSGYAHQTLNDGWGPRWAFDGTSRAWGGRKDSANTFWIGKDFGSQKSVKCIKLQTSSKPANWVGVQLYTTRNKWEQEGPIYHTKENEWAQLRVVGASDCADKRPNDGQVGKWRDSDGPVFDCDWYSHRTRCSAYGHAYAWNGLTANQACCACGGGDNTHCVDISVTVRAKSWGSEISWSLVATNPGWWEGTSGETSEMNGGPYSSHTINKHSACLKTPGTYRMEARDSWGDGWHGGYFQVSNANQEEVHGSGKTMTYVISPSK